MFKRSNVDKGCTRWLKRAQLTRSSVNFATIVVTNRRNKLSLGITIIALQPAVEAVQWYVNVGLSAFDYFQIIVICIL